MKRIASVLISTIAFAGLTACEDKDLTNFAVEQPFNVQLTGGPTTLLHYGDTTIVTDPTFDDAGGRYDIKLAVLEKTKSPTLAINTLPEIDLVLLSHDQHDDNFDHAGKVLAAQVPLTLTTNEGARRLGEQAQGLTWWENLTVNDITITAVPAQHGPAQAVSMLGPVNGFIISSDFGPTVYISGDTIPFAGTDQIVERYNGQIDYAILHTGAVGRGDSYFTMKAEQAIKLASQLNAKSFSIVHADSWAHFTENLTQASVKASTSAIGKRYIDLSDNRTKPFYNPTKNATLYQSRLGENP